MSQTSTFWSGQYEVKKFNFVRYEDEKPADDHDSERDG